MFLLAGIIKKRTHSRILCSKFRIMSGLWGKKLGKTTGEEATFWTFKPLLFLNTMDSGRLPFILRKAMLWAFL